MVKELEWWVMNINTQVRHIGRINTQRVNKSDASLMVQNETYGETGGRMTHIEMSIHINYLAILAIFHALKSFKIYLRNIAHVKILTAVAYNNTKGGIKLHCKNYLAVVYE